MEEDRRKSLRRADDSENGCPYLTPEQIESIAETAAERAVKKMTDNLYRQVGKGVLSKILWVLGVFGVATYMWLRDRGIL